MEHESSLKLCQKAYLLRTKFASMNGSTLISF